MRRISQDTIRYTIYVKLRTYPKRVLRAMASKLPHEADDATDEIAEAIAELVAGGECRIVAPDFRSSSWDNTGTPGKWGPDDPDPTERL